MYSCTCLFAPVLHLQSLHLHTVCVCSFIHVDVLHASSPYTQEVTLNREGSKLGISIKGGGSESVGNPFDLSDEGIFISKVHCACTCTCTSSVLHVL